jgi:DNA-binding NarL/FixJ family response regulator
MSRQASPRFHAIKALAEELGLPALAAMEERAVRERPIPSRLLAALLRPNPPGEMLTSREREIMVLLTSGFSRQEIADELGIGEQTVKHHLKHVYAKFGVHRQIEAVNAFLEHAA